MTAAKRKPQLESKARSVGWEDEARGVLRIAAGGAVTLYRVERNEGAYGEAYAMTALTGKRRGTRYDLNLSGEDEGCTCGDCVYRERRCKHLLSLHAMKKAGRL
jgi:hypothetical protein